MSLYDISTVAVGEDGTTTEMYVLPLQIHRQGHKEATACYTSAANLIQTHAEAVPITPYAQVHTRSATS